jgi:hypothetical protein
MGTELFERRVVISGVGQSAIGRQVDRSGFQLTLDAILAAVADAGLTLDDIDGLAMFPGGGAANLPGYANGNLVEAHDALRITTTWRQGIIEGMALPFYGPAQAVATGQARHAVIWRTVKEGSAARNAGGRPAYGSTKPTADGPLAWLLPVGKPARSSRAAPASPWTANCRSTPGAASCPAAASTRPSATPPRPSASCAARRATARSRAPRSPRSPTPAGSRQAPHCSPAGKQSSFSGTDRADSRRPTDRLTTGNGNRRSFILK